MIPFFRKIRKKFADNNKPMKYMRYAIGEIVLVVVGILIALSFNNWNQNVANKLKAATILEQIERELLEDVQYALKLNLRWQQQDSIYNIAISDSVSIDMYRKYPRLSYLTFYTEQNIIQMNGFELLKQNANLIDKSLNPLLSKMSKMYTYYSQEFAFNLQGDGDFSRHYNYEMAKDYTWFYKSKLSDEWLEYFATSSAYKNQLWLYKSEIISKNLGDSKRFITQAVEILRSIEEILTGEKRHLKTIWSKFVGPFTTFKLKPCQENIPASNPIRPSNSKHQIFTNNTSEKIEFRIVNRDGIDIFYEPFNQLESGESVYNPFVANVSIKVLDAKGNCIGYHVTTKENSVILIE